MDWPKEIELTVFGSPEILKFWKLAGNRKAIYCTGDKIEVFVIVKEDDKIVELKEEFLA